MNYTAESNLIFDWSAKGPRRAQWPDHVMIDDETLRDGLQSPSVSAPSPETKVAILHLMEGLGIETADVGLPGAGPEQREAVTTLCGEIDAIACESARIAQRAPYQVLTLGEVSEIVRSMTGSQGQQNPGERRALGPKV